MAKALLGHVGPLDHRMVAEISRLRARVSELEGQVRRLESENDALASELHRDELISLTMDSPSPVLAGRA